MQNYYADLSAPNPVKTLRDDDAIAISANGIEITYREFNKRIKYIALELASSGITDMHRVLVVGDPADMITTCVLTWGIMYLGASSTNASCIQSIKEIELRTKSANVDAVLWTDGTLDIKSDLSTVTKSHPLERFLYFTSGTTMKDGNLYTVEPGYFTYPADVERGFAIQDEITLANEVLGDYTQLKMVITQSWEIAYTPHNVCKSLLTGGSFHWVSTDKEVPLAHAKYKSNMMSTYPIQVSRLCEFEYETPIPFIEISGGAVTDELVSKVKSSMKSHTVSNSFGACGSGLVFVNLITDKSTDCEWFEQPSFSKLTIKLDENNQLWTCRSNEWRTDNDLFEEKDGKYRYMGRSNDEILIVGGGKVSTWEIEDYVHAIVTPAHNNAGNVYVFPMNGLDGFSRHGLIYSGSLSIEKVQETLSDITQYKQPQKIYQVTDDFWGLYLKISRSRMSERITEHREYVLNSIEINVRNNRNE
jgi:acyl-CoA synthetase (AMP-forming)/AMP-acid ligase II